MTNLAIKLIDALEDGKIDKEEVIALVDAVVDSIGDIDD